MSVIEITREGLLERGSDDPAICDFLALLMEQCDEHRNQTGDNDAHVQLRSGIAEAITTLTALAQVPAMDAELRTRFEQGMAELFSGPIQTGTFIDRLDIPCVETPVPRCSYFKDSGEVGYAMLSPTAKPEPGQRVVLDQAGRVVLGVADNVLSPQSYLATVKQVVDDHTVIVSSEGMPSHSILVRPGVEAKVGDHVLCLKQGLLYGLVPKAESNKHRFVDDSRLPTVDESSYAETHWCVGWAEQRLRAMVYNRPVMAKFRLPPRASILMVGPPGVGKTFSIKVILSRFGQLLSRLGCSDGSRVIRAKASELISKWLGDSEKLIDAFFDDIISLASQEHDTPAGRMNLPVVVILEEVDSITMPRGIDYDTAGGAYSRILGTLLQRWDDPMDEIHKLPILFLATSNRPSAIDPAAFRRLGQSRVAYFTQLTRDAFCAVLRSKVSGGYPLSLSEDKFLREVADAIYINDSEPRLEAAFRSGGQQSWGLSSFVTPAMIDTAIARAAEEIVLSGEDGVVSPEMVISALLEQAVGLMKSIRPHSVGDYFELPEPGVVQVRFNDVRETAAATVWEQ